MATSSQINVDTSSSDVFHLSPSLKFLIANIKNLIPIQLSADNYHIWRAQLLKAFTATEFDSFLFGKWDESLTSFSQRHWTLVDHHLSAAICATILAPVLPYVLNLSSTCDIWTTLEVRFQATHRARIMQLKHELHTLDMQSNTMTEYLLRVKTIVDNLSAAGSVVDLEDVILYILQGLPPKYQGFKTVIRNSTQPLSLDAFYSLLSSEEINLANEASKSLSTLQISYSSVAMFSSRGQGRSRGSYRGAGRRSFSPNPSPFNSNSSVFRGGRSRNYSVVCQIWRKAGHEAAVCWHRSNLNYTPAPTPPQALLSSSSMSAEHWFLDSGASTHMTSNSENFTHSSPYLGSDHILVGNGQNASISSIGDGLLPTPDPMASASRAQ